MPRVRYDLTLRYAIAPRCFYVSGVRWSFYTTKTRTGHTVSSNQWSGLMFAAENRAGHAAVEQGREVPRSRIRRVDPLTDS
jgi:hypothetical protein